MRLSSATLCGRSRNIARILILGGSGFIGRHAVAAALARGLEVTIGSRHPERIDHKLPSIARDRPRVAVQMEGMHSEEHWRDIVLQHDAVINCVGILRQRSRETYDAVHHLAVVALAKACRGRRLIHVSALGLQAPARSRFLTSKRRGEVALMDSHADWFLVRPSLLDGEGGFGAKWLQRVAQWPVHPLPSAARGRIAAFDVSELGECLCALAIAPRNDRPTEERIVELGGPHALSLPEYLRALRHSPSPAKLLTIPNWLARLTSHVCDVLHLTPFSFGHWELLQRDNLPQRNRAAEWLGRAPAPVGRLLDRV